MVYVIAEVMYLFCFSYYDERVGEGSAQQGQLHVRSFGKIRNAFSSSTEQAVCMHAGRLVDE